MDDTPQVAQADKADLLEEIVTQLKGTSADEVLNTCVWHPHTRDMLNSTKAWLQIWELIDAGQEVEVSPDEIRQAMLKNITLLENYLQALSIYGKSLVDDDNKT